MFICFESKVQNNIKVFIFFSLMSKSRCFFISKTHTKPRQECHRRKYFVQTSQNKRGKSVKKKNSNNKIKKKWKRLKSLKKTLQRLKSMFFSWKSKKCLKMWNQAVRSIYHSSITKSKLPVKLNWHEIQSPKSVS